MARLELGSLEPKLAPNGWTLRGGLEWDATFP